MIYLHQYPAVWGLPSLSPFCIKVETFLRAANLPYQIKVENNPRRGPKGKMPVLQDGTRVIADSSFIIDYLTTQYRINLDDDLTAAEKAVSHAVQKMVEENLYFIILYSRWIDPHGKVIIDNEFRQFFPRGLGWLALKIIRRNLKKQAHQQGLGRHTQDEIYALGSKDIKALSNLLGTQDYFFGSNLHTIDIIVYAFLMTILNCPYQSPLKTCLLEHKNLLGLCENMHDKFYRQACQSEKSDSCPAN